MRKNISQRIREGRFYLDGGMGSSLIAMNYSTNGAELLNVSHPDVIQTIHKRYINNGSDIVYTNTFGANRLKLTNADLKTVIESAVENARKAAGEDKYVGYSCGPLGELLYPFGDLSFNDAYEYFKEQAEIVQNTDVDVVVLETMTDLAELRAAILAFKENTTLPVWSSMSFEQNQRTYTGVGIKSFVLTAQGLGVDALGFNCGIGPDMMYDNAKEIVKYASVPVFVKPNAGMPYIKEGKTCYDMDAEAFSCHIAKIAELGISMLGGCCGTNEKYIEKTVKLTQNIPFKIFDNEVEGICSASKTVDFLPTVVIGERINPTGKPRLKQALVENDFDYIVSLASEQTEAGAQVLDINVGLGGIDEAAALEKAVVSVQAVSDLPLCVDTGRLSALERALRVTNGVALINSVNGEQKSMEGVFPLAKKYGAYVIGLCLDENGIPSTVEGRLEIAKRIILEAQKYGIKKEKLLFDALTMSISVDDNNANVTAETVRELNKLGVKTVLGLSNVSFGLPNRSIINGTFYKMMMDDGLTAVIINPSLKPAENPFAKDALLGKDKGCKKYIENVAGIKEEAVSSAELTIYDAVLKGLKGESLALAKRDVNKDNFMSVIDGEVIRALNDLGQKYEEGKAFLPQLIAGAESAKAVLDEIKANYMSGVSAYKATMLLATVKGDVHDIGKNIVKAVLSNYGYKIIDLGKDVGFDKIEQNIKTHNPSVVGLSALMTTTLDNMADTVKQIKEKYPEIIVAVGGAVVTQSFADTIGADVYSKDAQEAVRKLSKYFD